MMILIIIVFVVHNIRRIFSAHWSSIYIHVVSVLCCLHALFTFIYILQLRVSRTLYWHSNYVLFRCNIYERETKMSW